MLAFMAYRCTRPDASPAVDGDAERLLAVFFVGDADIRHRDELPHHLRRRLAVLPEILAIVVVARHSQPHAPSGRRGGERQLSSGPADCRGNAADVKPI